jgi:enamine deaminase RidA (YjgF/YER057c/UK114 family)
MQKKILNPTSLGRPSGFSHGVLTTGGRMLFLAGQTAFSSEGKLVAPGNLVGQYEEVLRHLRAVVEEAGGTMQDIVKINIFVQNRDDYLAHLKPLGQVHKAFFGSYYPATALFEVSRFYQDGILVEIEGIAVLDDETGK